MGYDLNRFVKEVDEEFLCPICAMVLENGVQSKKCEHTYCEECIKKWFSFKKICPVDTKELKFKDMKPIPRVLKNLIMKLEIKCDFEPHGCRVVVKVENLAKHTKSCVFDPNSEISRNRKLGLEMTQSEYESRYSLRKLVSQQKQMQQQLENVTHSIRNIHRWFSPNGLTLIHNTIECHKTNFKGLQYELASAQCRSILNENSDYFEIKVIDLGNRELYYGTSHCLLTPVNCIPNRIIYDGTNGEAYIRIVSKYKRLQESNAPKWQNGDTIGCGIKFTKQENLTDNKNKVYFTRNKQIVWERSVNGVEFGLYPTFWTNSYGSKIIVNSI